MPAVSARSSVAALKQTRSLGELLPWAVGLKDDIVLCKDGSILFGFTFEGMDTEGRGAEEIAGDAELLERAFGAIASRRLQMWWTVRRDCVDGWTYGRFDDPVMRLADEAAHREWQRDRHYVNQRAVWIALTPPTAGETLLTRIGNEGGGAMWSGLLPWVKQTLYGASSFEADTARLQERVREADDLAERVTSLFPAVRLSRLVGPRLHGWLNALATPSAPYHPVDARTGIQALDDVLGEDALEQSGAGMEFRGSTRTVYAAALSPKTMPSSWPDTVHPGVLDDILNVDCECVFSLAIRFLDPDQARAQVKQRRTHMLNWSKGLKGHIKQAVAKVETDVKDSDKEVLARDADAALLDLMNTPAAGWIFPAVYVRGESPEHRDRAVADLVRSFHIAGFTLIRERMHQIAAWAGTLPGQWGIPVRWTYASGAAIADLAPIRGPSRGSTVNRHLSRQLGQKQPALAVFPTRTLEPYWLEPHLGDVGHTLILGPTGAGKSVLGGWLAMRWKQYPGARTYIFDKDRSLQKMVVLCDGEYLESGEGGLRVNPFAGLESDDDWAWASGFVGSLMLAEDQEELPAADENEITTALRRVRSLPTTSRQLRSLTAFLPQRLNERLSKWVDHGRYAGYFDHEHDGMAFGSLIGVAMDDVLRFPVAARAFMDLAFHRITKLLDGSPTYIHIEEGWFLMDQERFANKLNDWARTLRKLNGLLVISTQALDELAESKSFRGLASAPNRLLLPNRDIYTFEALYRDNLGLTAEQIRMIAGARPKGEAVLVRDGRARVLNTTMPPEVLALMTVDTRSDALFERWRATGQRDWRIRYVNEYAKEDRTGQ